MMKSITYKKILVDLIKWCALGVLIGALGGVIGAGFAHLLSFVTGLRQAAPWLVVLLPVGGIATVLLYRAFDMEHFGGTNEITASLTSKKTVRPIAAPLIFVSSAITHLFGGSAGREGAALQLGGAGASALCRVLRLHEQDQAIAMLSGMSAVFAGLFGTPLTAALFVLEFKLSRKTVGRAILPCFLSSLVAQKVSSALAVAAETAEISGVDPFSFSTVAKIFVLSLGLGVLGRLQCFAFHKTSHFVARLIPNALLRSASAAAVIVLFTAMVGDMRYNGSGMPMAILAVEGKADWFDFVLKILFTAVTLSAGLKGGEIVPTFCVGASFGCVFGGLLGLDPGFSAALGLVGLFCCTANSPVSAVFLGIEMFGFGALPHFIILCILLWLLSVNRGLFENRSFRSPLFSEKARRAYRRLFAFRLCDDKNSAKS